MRDGCLACVDPAHSIIEPTPMEVKLGAITDADAGHGRTAALLGTVAGVALVLFALWPTARSLATTWSVSDSYRYGWLVLPTMVYLLGWHHRTLVLALAPRPGFAGLGVTVLAALLWGVAELMNVDVGRQFALVLALQGVAMSALGWRAYWRLFAILALLFLAVPSGDLLLSPLRRLTLESMVWFTELAGMSPRVDGYVVGIGQGAYIVIDECAGLTYVTMGLFLGYSLGLMMSPSFFKAAALALAGAAMAIVSNIVRVNAIVLIDWLRGSHMDLTAHSRFQTFALVLSIGLLFLVFYRLAGTRSAEPANDPASENARPGLLLHRLAPAFAGMAVLLVALGLARMDQADPSQASCVAAPDFLPGRLLDGTLGVAPTAWAPNGSHPVRSIRGTYRLQGRDIQVVVVETDSATAKLPHMASLVGEPGQWREKQVRTRDLCAADGCVKLQQTTWSSARNGDQRQTAYAYQVGPLSTPSDLVLRTFRGWYRLTGHPDRPRMVTLIYDGEAPLPAPMLAAVFRSLQAAIASHPC
jgi:exosortase